MNAQEALQEGEFSKITPSVIKRLPALLKFQKNYEIPERIKPYPEEIHKAYQTAAFVRKLKSVPEQPESFKYNNFRSRSIDDLLTKGHYPTCSDTGLLFRTFMIAQNIPTTYLETFHEKLFLYGKNSGHIYANIYTPEGKIIMDPTNYENKHILFRDEQELFDTEKYVIIAEVRDQADIGVNSWEKWKNYKREQLPKAMKTYESLLDKEYQHKKKTLREQERRLQDSNPQANV